jgi:excisionase family DNA binding protein
MGERLIDVSVVARVLNVCTATVRNWIRAEKVVAIKTSASGHYRIPSSEVDRLKKSLKSTT